MTFPIEICEVIVYNYPCRSNSTGIRAKLKTAKKPDGYATHLSCERRWLRMEIAYIVAMALVAVVAILANRRTKK